MNETKFTKGEWEVTTEPSSEHYCLNIKCGNVMGLLVITRATDITFEDSQERIANAHLIAAAPEMYEMVRRQFTEIRILKSRLEYLGDNNDYDKEILQDAIDLLTKARGEHE